MTRLQAELPRLDSRQGQEIFSSPRLDGLCNPPSAYRDYSPEVKRLGA